MKQTNKHVECFIACPLKHCVELLLNLQTIQIKQWSNGVASVQFISSLQNKQ